MSRIGNRIIKVPDSVKVEKEADLVKVTGPKGELTLKLNSAITMEIENDEITLKRKNDLAFNKAMHGTMNANLTNMIIGVKEGYKKGLEIIGVGYRFNRKGDTLVISAGFSHNVEISIPPMIELELLSNTEISLTSIDKVLLGEFAAKVREVRPPEPYKGKGIRYKDEHIRRKEGKKAA